MTNNFEIIKPLLVFDSADDFYHLQIIKRKKDNPGLPGRNNNARCVKTYYVTSIEYLEEKKEEIIALSTLHNARACINLNRRSFEKIAFQTLIKITGQIMSKDFKSARRAYESVCGAYSNEPHTKWIVDVDDLNFNALEFKDLIRNAQPLGDKYIATIPTKNGYHLIVKPFDIRIVREENEFNSKGWNIDIHKDNPTILYVP
jgi:hypothetical protein